MAILFLDQSLLYSEKFTSFEQSSRGDIRMLVSTALPGTQNSENERPSYFRVLKSKYGDDYEEFRMLILNIFNKYLKLYLK
jgi:hypothetical protein